MQNRTARVMDTEFNLGTPITVDTAGGHSFCGVVELPHHWVDGYIYLENEFDQTHTIIPCSHVVAIRFSADV